MQFTLFFSKIIVCAAVFRLQKGAFKPTEQEFFGVFRRCRCQRGRSLFFRIIQQNNFLFRCPHTGPIFDPVIQIRPDKLANEAPKTIQDVMRGTPGLNVGYDASAKGGGSLQVRGQRSVYTSGGHNDPLIILDGMQFYGELSEINPQDIAQIDVLKDASAAAVYGAKGANGVIAITTKKGKLGKPTINVSATLGINQKSAYRDVFNASEYVRYLSDWHKADTYGVNPETGRYEAYQTGDQKGQYGFFDNPYALPNGVTQDQWAAYDNHPEGAGLMEIWGLRLGMEDAVLQNFINGKTFDWYDSTFRTGINQDYNASISGASERMNYYMSFGYQSNEGAIVGNDYSAFRANLKVSGKVTDWLEIGANINFQARTVPTATSPSPPARTTGTTTCSATAPMPTLRKKTARMPNTRWVTA